MSIMKENRNCPYCLSPVEQDEARVRCPKCGVIHHEACWRENGKCSVYGCDGWAVWSSQISDRLAPDPEGTVEVVQSDGDAQAVTQQLCIKCGQPVKKNQLTCRKCKHAAGETHYFENCFGPAVFLLAGTATVITLVVRALV